MPYNTRQREAVWSVLDKADRPLTPADICVLARTDVPSVSVATVYRALKQFLAEGQVRCVELAGAPPHYESMARMHHHFFLCTDCRRVYDVAGCARGVEALAPEGCEVTRHEIVLYGECRECLTK